MGSLSENVELGKLALSAYEHVERKKEFVQKLKQASGVVYEGLLSYEFLKGYGESLVRHSKQDLVFVTLATGFGYHILILDNDTGVKRICERALAVPKTEKKPTPLSVLQRMCFIRMSKMEKARQLQIATRQNYFNNPSLSGNAAWLERIKSELGTLQDLSYEKLDRATLKAWMESTAQCMSYDALDEMEDFLDRGDVTDEVLQSAANKILVGEVMES